MGLWQHREVGRAVVRKSRDRRIRRMPSGDTINRNRSHRGHSTTAWKMVEHQQMGPHAFLLLRMTSNLSLSVPSGKILALSREAGHTPACA